MTTVLSLKAEFHLETQFKLYVIDLGNGHWDCCCYLSLPIVLSKRQSCLCLAVCLAACCAYLQHSQRDCHNHSVCLPATAIGAVDPGALSTPFDAGHCTLKPHIQPLCQALCQRLQAAGMTVGSLQAQSPEDLQPPPPPPPPVCYCGPLRFRSRPRHCAQCAATCGQQGQWASLLHN